MSYKLLSVGADSKTKKGVKFGYLTGILYMSPAQVAGGRTMCPFSTPGCRAACLNTAGRGAFTMVQEARIRKTKAFQAAPVLFVNKLCDDIRLLVKQAARKGLTPAVRLNGVTDVEWEKFGIMEQFPDVTFYDYTKHPPTGRKNLPPNYTLTFSYSEAKHSPEWAQGWLERGVNAAVVFNGSLPDMFLGRPVINGDESDLRFTDPVGVIVGLKTKGSARKAEVGPGFFVQEGAMAA